MVPGKRYAIEDYLQAAWRRKWLIVAPFVLGTIAAVFYARSLPSLYTSESLIVVVPQQVPRSYVTSTVTTEIDQRIRMINEQVLSRSRLEQMINEFNLYPELRQSALMEDVVQRMRYNDIVVDISRQSPRETGSMLRIAYTYTEPAVAKTVAERLASDIIAANLRDREMLAEGTDQFIEAELIEAERRLDEADRAVADYRRKYPWDQAEQVEHNRWVLVNTQQALDNTAAAIRQDRDRLLFLEKLQEDLQEMARNLPADPADNVPMTAAAQLESARASLRAMLLRLTPEHPDVVRARKAIEELERKAEAEALSAPVSASGSGAGSAVLTRDQRLLNTLNEIDILRARLREMEQKEENLRKLMAEQERRVETFPTRALEMQALQRDYEVIKSQYHELLRKKNSAKIAANLERQQAGEQMRVVEPARVPPRPVSPDRARINLLGALVGLGVGFALAAFVEYRDTSLRTEVDVVSALALPVLALLPVIRSAPEVRRQKRRRFIWSVAGVFTVATSIAAAAWTLWS